MKFAIVPFLPSQAKAIFVNERKYVRTCSTTIESDRRPREKDMDFASVVVRRGVESNQILGGPER